MPTIKRTFFFVSYLAALSGVFLGGCAADTTSPAAPMDGPGGSGKADGFVDEIRSFACEEPAAVEYAYGSPLEELALFADDVDTEDPITYQQLLVLFNHYGFQDEIYSLLSSLDSHELSGRQLWYRLIEIDGGQYDEWQMYKDGLFMGGVFEQGTNTLVAIYHDDGSNLACSEGGTTAELFNAIQRDFLDRVLHGQPIEMEVESYEYDGDFAWVTGSVRSAFDDIEWSDTDYAEAWEEGLFAGPYFQALVQRTDRGWEVAEADMGATDVWYANLWTMYAVDCRIFGLGSCPSVSEPTPGTAGRRAITDAIHVGFLDDAVNGQENELLISWIRESDNYAFVQATVQAKGGGEIDWSDSDYSASVEEGFFDGPHLQAFLVRGEDGEWLVDAHDIGATNVWWLGLWSTQEEVPCALFPLVNVCE